MVTGSSAENTGLVPSQWELGVPKCGLSRAIRDRHYIMLPLWGGQLSVIHFMHNGAGTEVMQCCIWKARLVCSGRTAAASLLLGNGLVYSVNPKCDHHLKVHIPVQ
jgi:hypothetical protein